MFSSGFEDSHEVTVNVNMTLNSTGSLEGVVTFSMT